LPLYYAYILDDADHVRKRHDFETADDAAALKHARRWVDGCNVEVWQFARLVAKLVHGKQMRVVWPPLSKNGKRNNNGRRS
jgi:hypothetical protein